MSTQIWKQELQERFIRLLRQLTDNGKVEWARESTLGHIHCLAADEYIRFEISGASKGFVAPDSDQIAYVTGYCRNVTYLWVPATPGWDSLIQLLREAPLDDDRVTRFRKSTLDSPVKALEKLAG